MADVARQFSASSSAERVTATKRPVVLIGPSATRHRGGIAGFTSTLAGSLARRSALCFLGWDEQYPRLLRKNTPPSPPLVDDGSENILSYSSPASWAALVERVVSLRPERIVLTWSHPVHAPVYATILRRLRARTSAELVLVCHNVLPHEPFPGAAMVSKAIFSLVDRIVVHSRDEALRLYSLIGRTARCTVSFHPAYETTPIERSLSGRDRLLFFGFIRRYKGLDILLDAIPSVLEERPRARLTIAGASFSSDFFSNFFSGRAPFGYSSTLRTKLAALGDRVIVRDGYVPDTELPSLFSETDLAICPFRAATQSGSLLLALSHGVPVVATDVSGARDVVRDGENGWLAAAENPASLARSIVYALAHPLPPERVRRSVSTLSWDRYVDLLLSEQSS